MCLWETHMWPNCVTNTLVSALICSQVLNFRLVFVQITKHHWFYEYLVASVWTFKFCIEFHFAMEICQPFFPEGSKQSNFLFQYNTRISSNQNQISFFSSSDERKIVWLGSNVDSIEILTPQSWWLPVPRTYCSTVGYHQYLVTYCTQY